MSSINTNSIKKTTIEVKNVVNLITKKKVETIEVIYLKDFLSFLEQEKIETPVTIYKFLLCYLEDGFLSEAKFNWLPAQSIASFYSFIKRRFCYFENYVIVTVDLEDDNNYQASMKKPKPTLLFRHDALSFDKAIFEPKDKESEEPKDSQLPELKIKDFKNNYGIFKTYSLTDFLAYLKKLPEGSKVAVNNVTFWSGNEHKGLRTFKRENLKSFIKEIETIFEEIALDEIYVNIANLGLEIKTPEGNTIDFRPIKIECLQEEKPKSHYANHPSGVECIEITKHASFLQGNVIKYVWRSVWGNRSLEDRLKDLKKARDYLNWEIERLEKGNE